MRRLPPEVVFVVLAFALAWLVAVPLYLWGGLANPFAPVVAVAMMATPAIAALVVVRFVDRPASIPRSLGLWPLRPARRFIGFLAIGLVLPIALVLIALPVGAMLGLYPADFVHFSGFAALVEEQLAAVGAPPMDLPIQLLVALQLVNVLLGSFINVIPALGEELGWRGYLFPRLLRLGVVPAILISGVIWGLWHAPLLLLGYNYPMAPGWLGVVLMCGTCIVLGGIFGWLRVRSASVWPAALAHGSLNAAAGFAVIFAAAGEEIDTVNATILGWSGWLVPAVILVILVLRNGFRPATPAPEARAVETQAVDGA